MSLTTGDLQQIRNIVQEVVRSDVAQMLDSRLKPLKGEIKALRNDIKEIYIMIADCRRIALT